MDIRRMGAALVARLLGVALGVGVASCHDSSTANGGCQSPCDLAQTVTVQIGGTRPAATISASDPCTGGIKCGAGGCLTADVFLKNESGGTSADGAPDLVCHVTAVSVDGVAAEADITATYTLAACCSGYEFQTRTITLTFAPADAAADAAMP